MANTTLQAMQEIEQAAQSVLADYDQQIKDLKASASSDLELLSQSYDQKNQAELEALQETFRQEVTTLEQELEANMAKNKTAVSRGLTDKKEALVQAIVDKVVENYGN